MNYCKVLSFSDNFAQVMVSPLNRDGTLSEKKITVSNNRCLPVHKDCTVIIEANSFLSKIQGIVCLLFPPLTGAFCLYLANSLKLSSEWTKAGLFLSGFMLSSAIVFLSTRKNHYIIPHNIVSIL